MSSGTYKLQRPANSGKAAAPAIKPGVPAKRGTARSAKLESAPQPPAEHRPPLRQPNGLVAIPASKHLQITQTLADDIQRGKYKVGEPLPAENALARSFGVSRQTLRVALRNLRELGLVTSRQGVGNIVRSAELGAHYMFTSDSDSNLLEHVVRTHLKVVSLADITTDEDLAQWIGCREGEIWTRLETIRHGVKEDERIAHGYTYVPYALGAALRMLAENLGDDAATMDGPLFPLTRRLNMPLSSIQQTVSAVLISKPEAKLLNVAPGSAGLLIIRHHYNRRGDVMEVTRALHPAHLFSYSMSISVSQEGGRN